MVNAKLKKKVFEYKNKYILDVPQTFNNVLHAGLRKMVSE